MATFLSKLTHIRAECYADFFWSVFLQKTQWFHEVTGDTAQKMKSSIEDLSRCNKEILNGKLYFLVQCDCGNLWIRFACNGIPEKMTWKFRETIYQRVPSISGKIWVGKIIFSVFSIGKRFTSPKLHWQV